MQSLQEYLSEALVKHKISNYDDDIVDFGLSVKWLKYNLAGDRLTDDESDYGYYYQWGSTVGYPNASKHEFTWETTPFIKSAPEITFTKYVTNSKFGAVDNNTILDPEDDAVTSLLGSEYRMPTNDEYEELYKHCRGTSNTSGIPNTLLSGIASISKNGIYWIAAGTTVDEVKYKNCGALFVGQDITNRIFFPASGNCNRSYVNDVGSTGFYWSSSLYSRYSNSAYYLSFYNGYVFSINIDTRYDGFAIRGVKVK